VLSEILAHQDGCGMSQCSDSQIRRGRRQQRGVEKRNCGPLLLLFKQPVFESRKGIAAASDAGVAFDGIISKPQFQIFEQTEFQQSIDVLVSVGGFESVFDFKNAALHRFRSCRERRTIGHRGEDPGGGLNLRSRLRRDGIRRIVLRGRGTCSSQKSSEKNRRGYGARDARSTGKNIYCGMPYINRGEHTAYTIFNQSARQRLYGAMLPQREGIRRAETTPPFRGIRYPATMRDQEKSRPPELREGLCAECRNARRIRSDRGSVFLLCELSASDPRFAKYPRLPVLQCAGYAPLPVAEPPKEHP